MSRDTSETTRSSTIIAEDERSVSLVLTRLEIVKVSVKLSHSGRNTVLEETSCVFSSSASEIVSWENDDRILSNVIK